MIVVGTVVRSLASALIVALLLAAPLIAHELLVESDYGQTPAGVSIASAGR